MATRMKMPAIPGKLLRRLGVSVMLCAAPSGVNAAVANAAEAPPSFSGGCYAKGDGNLKASELGDYSFVMLQEAGRLQATTEPGWKGGCAIRVEVREGDVDSNATDRAEMAGNKIVWRAGDDVWYAMSFMLDSQSPMPSPSGWMLVDQFFAQDKSRSISGGSPPLALEVEPQEGPRKGIFVHVRGGAKPSAEASAPRDSSYRLSEASPGSWHELLIHVKWSGGSDGLVEVWQRQPNGLFSITPQVSATGPNVLTVAGDVLPVYAETGIYRSRAPYAQVVYYGGLWARPDRVEAEGFFTPLGQAGGEPNGPPTGVTSPSQPPTEHDAPVEQLSTQSPLPALIGSPASAVTRSGPLRPKQATQTKTAAVLARTVKLRARRLRLTLEGILRHALRASGVGGAVVGTGAGQYTESVTVTRVLNSSGRRIQASIGAVNRTAIAVGQMTVAAGGRYRIAVRLTSTGLGLLLHVARQRLRLSAVLSFTASHGSHVSHSMTAQIRL
jgi:hypothetical protein